MKTILLCLALFGSVIALGAEPTNAPTVRANRPISERDAGRMLDKLDLEYAGLVRQLTNALPAAESRSIQKNREAYAEFKREAELHQIRNGSLASSFGAPVYRAPFSVDNDPSVKAIRTKIQANRNHAAQLKQAVVSAKNNDPKVVSEKQAKRDEAVKNFRAEQAAKGESANP